MSTPIKPLPDQAVTSPPGVDDDIDGVIPLSRTRSEEAQTDDPFDPRNLRVSQDFASAVPVRKVITNIVTEKPRADMFFRTHPDPAYTISTAVLEVTEPRREVYLVAPALRSAFS